MTTRQRFIRRHSKAGLIVGLVVGLLVAAALIMQGVAWWWALVTVGSVCAASWAAGNLGARVSIPKGESQ